MAELSECEWCGEHDAEWECGYCGAVGCRGCIQDAELHECEHERKERERRRRAVSREHVHGRLSPEDA
jgi:hypothetical protein